MLATLFLMLMPPCLLRHMPRCAAHAACCRLLRIDIAMITDAAAVAAFFDADAALFSAICRCCR